MRGVLFFAARSTMTPASKSHAFPCGGTDPEGGGGSFFLSSGLLLGSGARGAGVGARGAGVGVHVVQGCTSCRGARGAGVTGSDRCTWCRGCPSHSITKRITEVRPTAAETVIAPIFSNLSIAYLTARSDRDVYKHRRATEGQASPSADTWSAIATSTAFAVGSSIRRENAQLRAALDTSRGLCRRNNCLGDRFGVAHVYFHNLDID